MTKRLLVLIGMMALSLIAAVPAFAQDGISGPSKEVVVTGVLRALDVDCYECAHYAITDEATGTDYKLISDPRNPYGGVDLSQYVGLKVTAHGTPQFNADDLYVTQIQPADGPSRFPPGTVVATFELDVKGEVPAGTEFFGIIGSPEIATGLLMDQDGDGVYTVSLPVQRGTEQEVLIQRAYPISDEPMAPLVTSTFKDFGSMKFDEDKTFRAKVNFKKDRGHATTPESTTLESTTPDTGDGGSVKSSGNSGGGGSANSGNSGSSGSGSSNPSSGGSVSGGETKAGGVQAKELPKTGGATPPIAGVAGALLVGGGLLIRRLSR